MGYKYHFQIGLKSDRLVEEISAKIFYIQPTILIHHVNFIMRESISLLEVILAYYIVLIVVINKKNTIYCSEIENKLFYLMYCKNKNFFMEWTSGGKQCDIILHCKIQATTNMANNRHKLKVYITYIVRKLTKCCMYYCINIRRNNLRSYH